MCVYFIGGKKKVYTEAIKQMLISSPPPVLTLHLKRFQQVTQTDTHTVRVRQNYTNVVIETTMQPEFGEIPV